jgi:hypothetical protein
MTPIEVIQRAIPGAPEELCDHILWARTPFPVGRVTARSLYKAARGWDRAQARGIELCDFCDNRVPEGQRFLCERCSDALCRSRERRSCE